MSRLSPETLRAFSARVLDAVSACPDADAALVADSLVQADLWGHQSHGVLRLPWYVGAAAQRRDDRPHRPGRPLRHRAAGAARRPRRHRPGAHRAGPRDRRSSGPAPTAWASSASATPTTSARRCTSPAAPPHDGCVADPDHEREPGHGAVGRAGEGARHQPVVDRGPRPRRARRRRRHRQHRGGAGQDLPGEEPRRADPRHLGARPPTARRRPTRRRECSA